jgi:outer membrane protein OmpA-like peptidoglycan-associated protein/sugar lactone lactonase YvrE
MKQLSLLIFLGVWGLSVYGQAFVNYNTENAQIPSNQVFCIVVDKDNAKWMGTANGLAVLQADGQWRSFSAPADTLFKQVTAMAIDRRNDQKWLGAIFNDQVYLVKLDHSGKLLAHYPLPNFQNKNHYINGIAIDRDGGKWIATEEGGVWLLDAREKWYCYDQSTVGEELPSNSVKAIAIDRDNVKWIGTTGGLCSTETGREWLLYDLMNEINAIAVDEKNNVCVSTLDSRKRQQLYCNNELFKLARKDSREGEFRIAAMAIEKEGSVWTVGTGIGRYEKTERTVYDLANGQFGSNAATSVSIDANADLWVGSSDKGLFKFEPPKELPPPPVETRPDPMLMADLKPMRHKAALLETSLPKIPQNQLKNLATVSLQTLPEEKEEPPIIVEKPKEVMIENKKVKVGETIRLDNILFKRAGHQLENTRGVDILVRFMADNPTVKIELAGHTDKNPDPTHPEYARISRQHLELSQLRVQEVSNYLTSKGIAADRITTKAYGGDKPLINKSSEFNRRVEMKILSIE